jgi:hypothetical protein
MRSPDSKFILASIEHKIINILSKSGYSIEDIKGETTKELRVTFKGNVVAYISRKIGLAKGLFHISINPRLALQQDELIKEINAITLNPNKRAPSRFISSSNYDAFNSRNFCPNLTSNEHASASYKIDVNENFLPLNQFFIQLEKLI